MQPKPSSCLGCPAFDKGRGYVGGYGPTSATIAILGQGPSRQEIDGLSCDGGKVWRPFVGPSGAKLDRWFEVVNERRAQRGKPPVRRADIWIDNVVRCHLTQANKDRPPTKREVAHCAAAHALPALLALPNLRTVIVLGGPAATWLFGQEAGEGWAGHRQWVNLNERITTQ